MSPSEFEDSVLATFADGEPEGDLGLVASHLEECAACRAALEESRKLDALLAAQTRTELDETEAVRLLSFLDVEATDARRHVSVRGLVLASGLVAALAAALFVASLLWPRASLEAPLPERQRVARPVEPARPGEPTGPAESSPTTGFAVGSPARLARWNPRVRELDPARLRAAYEVTSRSGLSRSLLAHEARRIFSVWQALSPPLALVRFELRAEPALRVPGPRRVDESERLTVAAARWLVRQVDAGTLATDELLVAGRGLLATRGRLRSELVAALRTTRRRPRSLWPELAAALGDRRAVKRLAALPADSLQRCALEARRTGDAQSLRFLVDLWLALRRRSPALRAWAEGWFAGLSPAERAFLAGELAERETRSRSQVARARLTRLALRWNLWRLGSPRAD